MGPAPSLDNILGAAFIGILISSVIYGINCLQVYLYYTQHCQKDGRGLKIYVALLMSLDTLHVVLLAMAFYHYAVTYYGNYMTLLQDTWSLSAQVTIGGIMSLLVQYFFAYRVYHLSDRAIWIPLVVCLLGLAQFACSIVYTVVGYRNRYFTTSLRVKPFVTAALLADIVCDSLIAASMIYLLSRRRTQFPKTNRAINLLVTYALNTCFLTTVFTLICFITWYMLASTLIYAPFYFILVRLYSCSLMSTLNTRNNVRQVLGNNSHELLNIRSAIGAASGEGLSGRVFHGPTGTAHRLFGSKQSTADTASKASATLNDADEDKHAALP